MFSTISIGWLNFVAFQNILFMVCTRDVFHSPWFRHRSNQYYSTTFGGEAISYRLALICQCCVCWMGDQSPTTSVATASCLPYHSQILIVCRKERVKKKPQTNTSSYTLLYFLALSTHGNGWLHLTQLLHTRLVDQRSTTHSRRRAPPGGGRRGTTTGERWE